MTCPLRIEYPGAVYHVTTRDNERKPVFKTDRDRLNFQNTLQHVNIQRLPFRWKFFISVGLLLVFLSANAEALVPTATAPTATAHHGDPDIQQKRLIFIKNAIAVGFIAGIEDNGPITRVRVGQKFVSLSSEDKENILNVVWAYYITENPQKNVVLVIDQKSGKEIGEYSPAHGGLKMGNQLRNRN